MRNHAKLVLPLSITLFALVGCKPTSGPGPNPPDVNWTVRDTNTFQNQYFGQNDTVHLKSQYDTYMLTFGAKAPGGLTSMSLTAQGSVNCQATDSNGGQQNVGSAQISFPPQSATFNPTVDQNALLIQGFVFSKLDCHKTYHVPNDGDIEAFASSGTITLTGTATDTVSRKSTGQLQVIFP